jgi:hypothetical protein
MTEPKSGDWPDMAESIRGVVDINFPFAHPGRPLEWYLPDLNDSNPH